MQNQQNIVFKFSKYAGGPGKSTAKEITIEGFANRAVVDRVKENIMPDAWKLDNFRKNGTMLFNHDHNMPIGKMIEIKPTKDGLWLKGRISSSDHPDIRKVRDLIAEGILNSYSVSFVPLDQSKDGDGINNIKSAELLEVSVVSVPANQDSQFVLTSKDLKTKSIAEIKAIMKGSKMENTPDKKPCEGEKVGEKPRKPCGKGEETGDNGGEEFNSDELAGLVDVFNGEVEATEQGLPEGNPPSWVGDEALWEKAKRASQKAFGEIRYAFVSWFYLNTLNGPKKSVETSKAAGQDEGQGGEINQPRDIAAGDVSVIDLQKANNAMLGTLITEIKSMSKAITDTLAKLGIDLARAIANGAQPDGTQPAKPAEGEKPAAPAGNQEPPAEASAKMIDEMRVFQDNIKKRLDNLGV